MKQVVSNTTPQGQGRIELREFLNAHKVSNYQYFVFFLCFLILLLDGYDTVVVGFIAPALQQAWTLHSGDLALMFGMGLAGLAVGSFFSGPIADRCGRKGVILGSVALFAIVSLLSAWSTSIAVLTLLRFVAGLGLGGAMPNTYTLAAEFCPDRLRSTLVAPIGCGIGAGGALAGVLAAHMIAPYGWPSLLIVGGALPLLLLPVLAWMLPESIRYRVTSGKQQDKLLKTMQAIAPEQDFGGKRFVLDEVACAASGVTSDVIPSGRPGQTYGETLGKPSGISPGGKSPRGSMADSTIGSVRKLFGPNLLGGTVYLWIAAFACLLVVYFLGNWLPTLISNTGIPIARASLMTAMYLTGNTLGAIVLGYFMDRYNPQYVLAIAFVLAGVAMASFGYLIGTPLLSLLALFFTGVGSGGAMTCINILAAGFYPTQSRATGVSWTLAVGRIGSVSSSFMGGAMLVAHWRVEAIFATIAVPIFIAALSMLGLSTYRKSTARKTAAQFAADLDYDVRKSMGVTPHRYLTGADSGKKRTNIKKGNQGIETRRIRDEHEQRRRKN
jgi:AAHS family 4-hydroxybenzoate transporter-like MFS transporter